jgi:CubicO group peptidase (beta-lactamase class C family)
VYRVKRFFLDNIASKRKPRRFKLGHFLVVGLLIATLLLPVQIAAVLSSPIVSAPVGNHTSLTAKLDRYLQKARRDWQIPGLAVAITAGDEVIYLQSLSDDRSITPDTPFVLGSLSKSFTALAAMQLVEAGKLDLAAPVQRYLPWFQLADSKLAAQITLRHLLHHTSGFSMETDIKYLDTADTDRQPQALETSIRQLYDARAQYPVGEFHYANTNYNILGLIVEKVAGIPFGDYVDRQILQPLAMTHSYTSQIRAQQAQPSLTKGYRFWLNHPVETIAPYSRQNLPSGYVISSARDMTNYLRFHLGDGRYHNTRLLSEAGLQQLHQSGTPAWGGDYYAMGWVNNQVSGLPVTYHGGELVNFSSNMTLVPDRQWGVVVLTNISPGVFGDPIRKVYEGVIHILNDRQPPALKNDLGVQLLVFGLPAFVLMQLAGFFYFVGRRLTKRSQQVKNSRWFYLGVTYAVFFNAVIAIGFLIYLPLTSKVCLPLMLFAQPDLTGLALLSAAIAILSLCHIAIDTCFTSLQIARFKSAITQVTKVPTGLQSK